MSIKLQQKKYSSFNEIVDSIESSSCQLSVIRAPTGSGKSTDLPFSIFSRGLTCFLIAPKVISVMGLFNYMTNKVEREYNFEKEDGIGKVSNRDNFEREDKINKTTRIGKMSNSDNFERAFSSDRLNKLDSSGSSDRNVIGYAADSDVKYNNAILNSIRRSNTQNFQYSRNLGNINTTSIVYCTPGHMKKILYDCIRYFQSPEGMDPEVRKNLILRFCDYLILDEVHLGEIDITMIQRLWSILKKMTENIVDIPSLILTSATYSNDELPTFEMLDKVRWNVNISYLQTPLISLSDIYNEIIYYLENADSDNFQSDSGIWLVFLPGLQDIDLIARKISDSKYEIVKAHSSLSSIDMKKIFDRPQSNRRKLILATNIAETSLTIPHLSLIIDSMLEKIPQITASESLSLEYIRISKDSAKQRRGRTGRTCNGTVLRLCTEKEFDDFESSRQLEILRLPIINEAIHCLSAGIGNLEEVFYDVDESKIFSALNLLKNLDAISTLNTVTDLGDFVTKVPVSFKVGVFLYHWVITNRYPSYPGAVLAILIEMSDILSMNIPSSFDSKIPLGNLINIWNFMVDEYGEINISNKRISQYVEKYGLKFQSFCDLRKSIVELLGILRRLRPDQNDMEIKKFTTFSLYQTAHPILREIYPSYIQGKRKGDYFKSGKRTPENPIFQLDFKVTTKKSNPLMKQIVGFYSKKMGRVEKICLWFPYNDDFNYDV